MSLALTYKNLRYLVVKLILLHIVLCFQASLLAQNPILKHYGVDNGLPSSHVYCAIQDKKGYIWFGTDKGIARFDGRNFKNYTVKNGLPNNDCWGFDEDTLGRIWINSFNAPAFIENSEVKLFANEEFKDLGKISHMISPSGKNIVKSQYHKAWLFADIDSIVELPFIPGGTYIDIDEEGKVYVLVSEDGKLSIVTYDQHYSLIEKKFIVGLGRTTVADRFKVVKDNFFAVYEDVLIKIKGGRFETLDLRKKLNPQSKIKLFDRFGEKMFWGTEDNFFVTDFDLNILTQFDFLKEIDPNYVLQDNQKNLWICTSDGVYLLSEKNLENESFEFFEEGKTSGIKSMVELEEGVISMILESGHLYHYSVKKGIQYKGKCVQLGPRKLAKNLNNELYLIADLGIYNERKFEDKFDSFSPSLIALHRRPVIKSALPRINFDFIFGYPKDIAFLDDGRVLIGHSEGTSILIPNENHYEYQILGTSRANVVAYDNEGVIYYGGPSGLFKYENGKEYPLSEIENLFKYSISELAVDGQNRLWVGIDGFGLYVYDDGFLKNVVELSSVNINKIRQFKENELWIASNKGAFRIVIKDENKLDYFIQRFTNTDGLNSNEVNDLEMIGDNLFVGTKIGLSIIEDARKVNLRNDAPLLIQALYINDVSTPLKESYILEPDSNNIKIDFVGLSFNNSEYLTYQYRMIGLDSNWHSTQSTVKEFLSLPSGNYQFQLKCRDQNGRALDEIDPIQFVIQLPFYERLWVRLLLIGGFTLFGFWIYHININKIKANASKENKLNKKFAELEMQALQAQLNPHFIFNSLNAIQDYILSNDEKAANRYIVSFARLMRLFLEASRNKHIKISQEIELLRLYCELEKLRFGSKFDFNIQTHSKFGAMEKSIPSHLLQPFVENAINHGLNYKDSPGKLDIDFYFEEERLICTIVDNGVGLTKAKMITSKIEKDYQSQGMRLVKDRQTIFNFIENMQIKIDIEDNNPSADDVGTKVTVEIPYEIKN